MKLTDYLSNVKRKIDLGKTTMQDYESLAYGFLDFRANLTEDLYSLAWVLSHPQAGYCSRQDMEGLVELMNVVNLKALVLVKNINSTLVLKNIAKKSLWIGSNSASFKHDIEVVKPDRALRTFPFFLKYAEEKKGIALEALIKKMTSEPAKAFGIEGRGLIKEGMYADIVLFGGGVVRYVVVNGEVVVEDGNYASKFSGMILRKNTP